MAEMTQNKEESYQLKRAKGKLERLKKEFAQVDEQLNAHYKITNGQPMNDKRNGASWFKKKDRIEERGFRLLDEIKQQEERIEKLEDREENKALGLNRQGNGLEMSVANIPRIEEEIEKFKRGESRYTKTTIKRYEMELVKLKEMAKKAEQKLTAGAQKLVDDGLLRQWKKKPTIYFVTDRNFKKLALELNSEGKFEESSVYRYRATTDEAKAYVQKLLSMQKEINGGVTVG